MAPNHRLKDPRQQQKAEWNVKLLYYRDKEIIYQAMRITSKISARLRGLLAIFTLWLAIGFSQQAQAQNQQSVDERTLIVAKSDYIDGLTAFENQNYEQALELLKSAYVKLPNHPGVNYALSDVYLKINDLTNAEYYGKQAVKLEPQNRWYHLKLADVYRQMGRTNEVLEELNAALKYHPRDTSLLYEAAQAYSDLNQPQEANNIYNKLLYLQGEDISLHLKKLENFNRLGMRDSSVAELQQIRKLDPNNLSTLQVLSNYYMKMGRYKEAQEVLQNALEINNQDPKTVAMLTDLYVTNQQWDSLKNSLTDVLADSTTPAKSKISIARHLYSTYRKSPDNPELRNATSTILNMAMKQEPRVSRLQTLAADFFMQTRQYQPALEALERATALAPTDERAWEQRLQVLLNLGEMQQAITVGQKAAEQIPQNPVILYFLGSAQLGNQEFSKAIQNLEEANTLPVRRPLKARILASLGNAHASLKEWQQAFDYYQKSLDIENQNAGVLNNYAYYLSLQDKDLEKARQMAQAALEQDPRNPSYLDTLGWIFYQQGNYEQAENKIRAAIDAGGASAEVLEHMGDVMAKRNKMQEAKKWWRQALEKDSTRTYLKEKISK